MHRARALAPCSPPRRAQGGAPGPCGSPVAGHAAPRERLQQRHPHLLDALGHAQQLHLPRLKQSRVACQAPQRGTAHGPTTTHRTLILQSSACRLDAGAAALVAGKPARRQRWRLTEHARRNVRAVAGRVRVHGPDHQPAAQCARTGANRAPAVGAPPCHPSARGRSSTSALRHDTTRRHREAAAGAPRAHLSCPSTRGATAASLRPPRARGTAHTAASLITPLRTGSKRQRAVTLWGAGRAAGGRRGHVASRQRRRRRRGVVWCGSPEHDGEGAHALAVPACTPGGIAATAPLPACASSLRVAPPMRPGESPGAQARARCARSQRQTQARRARSLAAGGPHTLACSCRPMFSAKLCTTPSTLPPPRQPLHCASNPTTPPRVLTGPCSWRSSGPAAAPWARRTAWWRRQRGAATPRRRPGPRWQSPAWWWRRRRERGVEGGAQASGAWPGRGAPSARAVCPARRLQAAASARAAQRCDGRFIPRAGTAPRAGAGRGKACSGVRCVEKPQARCTW